MSDTVIKVENLSKSYVIRHQQGEHNMTLRDVLANNFASIGNRLWGSANGHTDTTHEEFWALNNVSFEVKQGERVGIIGRNGAGKSTLLKILSRITEPTKGRVHIKGRVASLLEVGTGFHPELTGRENIYLNGAILGMSREEIRRKFDEIVAFAEVEKFLDTPVKRYSSGMYVRLAFAVAAHLEPEILVVDEVLAVGDAAFQKKCLGKMEDVADKGRTILFVSHNMAFIHSLCSRVVLMASGKILLTGHSQAAIEHYITSTNISTEKPTVSLIEHPNRLAGMKSVLTEVQIMNSALHLSTNFLQSEDIVIKLSYKNFNEELLAGAGFIIESFDGIRIGGFNTYMALPPPHILPKAGSVRFTIRGPKLIPGRYMLTVAIGPHQHHLLDKIERVIAFDVQAEDIYGTGFLLTKNIGHVALNCETVISGV